MFTHLLSINDLSLQNAEQHYIETNFKAKTDNTTLWY